MTMIRFGVHCSLRKGLAGALAEAKKLGCEAMQIFTRSPRMWRMRVPPDDEIREFLALRGRSGIHPLVVHTPYLPNLATSKKFLYRRSVRALRDDMAVCEILHTDFLVIHPGAYSPESAPGAGIRNIAGAIRAVLGERDCRTVILLENVAGGGRRLGSSFGELAAIMDRIPQKKNLGVCFDTAHAFAAGYDLSSPRGIDRMLEEFDRLVGFSYLKMFHFNDSLVPFGSRKDRHAHLGKGYIGAKGFRYLIGRIKDVAAAGILETPKDSPLADRRNLSLLFEWRV